ncbi:endonuclease/exonuclease/phosphatase family protein [Nocardioides acrostichi]|uniref:Endonuclease/exonuclease/phosphatase family protein n=1 Tax=Nocardioides acrostichi TaxID=2784339 RepID=A0A930YCX7_9ACTN|nr:endonuclease/exonuclease/phosphatase family protein [Nocardioides acrostichi]MBF4161889.1 endonuclease/exonuclease/phosphatase family protein [Nocardioides acrostichi]
MTFKDRKHSSRERSGLRGSLVARAVLSRVTLGALAVALVVGGVVVGSRTDVVPSAAHLLSPEHGASASSSPSASGEIADEAVTQDPALRTQRVASGKQLHLTAAAKRELREQARLARLARIKARKARIAAAKAAKLAAQPFTIDIATFNVLGSNHTAPGGDRPNLPPASVRTPGAIGAIRAHGSDIVGMQELKPDQLGAITGALGYAAYPGTSIGDTDNSIIWNPSMYELVEGSTFPVVFMSRSRPQTIVKLRDKATGREFYVINMHPSAGHDPHNTSTRLAGYSAAVSQINRLKATGLPVFITGDMNDRAAFFCRVLTPTHMVAAVGGSTASGCRPPGRMPVDWVAGSAPTTFGNYSIDESVPARRISDHYYVSATASVPPAS